MYGTVLPWSVVVVGDVGRRVVRVVVAERAARVACSGTRSSPAGCTASRPPSTGRPTAAPAGPENTGPPLGWFVTMTRRVLRARGARREHVRAERQAFDEALEAAVRAARAKALVTSRPSSNTRTFAALTPAGILTATSASPAEITSARFESTSMPRARSPHWRAPQSTAAAQPPVTQSTSDACESSPDRLGEGYPHGPLDKRLFSS